MLEQEADPLVEALGEASVLEPSLRDLLAVSIDKRKRVPEMPPIDAALSRFRPTDLSLSAASRSSARPPMSVKAGLTICPKRPAQPFRQ